MPMIQTTSKPTDILRRPQAELILGDKLPETLKLAERIEAFIDRVQAATITTDAECGKLNDMLAFAKEAANVLEAERVELKAPILDEGRQIDSLYNPSLKAFERFEKVAKQKVKEHIHRKQEEAARQLAEAARMKEEAEEQQRQAALAAQAAKTEADRKAAEKLTQESTTALIQAHRAMPLDLAPNGVRSDFGNSTLSYRWAAKVTDITKVPREYLERALIAEQEGAHAKEKKGLLERYLAKIAADVDGNIQVDGADIFQDSSLTTRIGLQ